VQAARLPLDEVVPLFAALLSMPMPERYAPLHWSPQQQKQKTEEALVAWLLAEAERQPVLAVWEDLHWADPSSLEFVGLCIEQVPTAKVFLLLTCRPVFRPPWAPRSYLAHLTLGHLRRNQVAQMVVHLTGGKTLPATVLDHILTKTDGVPLFVEEITKAVLESGLLQEQADRYELTGSMLTLAIPTTLHDALIARLDRLGAAKGVAQLGATMGRQFAYGLLQAVSLLDEAALQHELGRLVEAELLYQRGIPPHATYTFKHALIQDAAYHALLKRTQQQYHQRIAQVLEAQFPETVETQPELVAQHYTEAGLYKQAVDYWERASQYSHERSAYAEALGHLTKGLEVLACLPATPERAQRELALLVSLGPILMVLKGFGAMEVEQTYTRARLLCEQLDESRYLPHVLHGLTQSLYASWRLTKDAGSGRALTAVGSAPARRFHGTRRALFPGGYTCWPWRIDRSSGLPGTRDDSWGASRPDACRARLWQDCGLPRNQLSHHCDLGTVAAWLRRSGASVESRGPNYSP
jgi:predicted ATPase